MPISASDVGDDGGLGLFASPKSRRNDVPEAANVSHGQNERSTCIELDSRNTSADASLPTRKRKPG